MNERRLARVRLAAAVALVAGITTVALDFGSQDGMQVAGSSERPGSASLRVTAETEVPYAPKGIAIAEDSVWVTTYEGVVRLDVDTAEVRGQTGRDGSAFVEGGHGLVVAQGRVWVMSPTTVDGHDLGDSRGAEPGGASG